ncbi:MAG: hypothetical protein K8U57_35925 [Planctomycetes bacterium]|nr:hypothetical protein [Planctomycetota bacterium]
MTKEPIDDSDKVVFLAFSNDKAPSGDRHLIGCKACRNKTFTCRTDLGVWPEIYCAACDARIGAFGWAEQEEA